MSASLVLELLKPGVSNFKWILRLGTANYFLKCSFGKGDGPSEERLAGMKRACIRLQRTQDALMYEHFDVLSHRGRWITVEVLHLKNETPLDGLLDEGLISIGFSKGLPVGDLIVMGQVIAHSVYKVHSFQPSGEIIGAEEYKRFQLPIKKEQMYAEALADVLTRAKVYMPVDNPFLSNGERGRFLQAMQKFSRSWTAGGSDRLCLVHGDLQRGNILMSYNPKWQGVLLIDFSPRVQIGEPRWDDGRFVGDLLQLYFETKDDRVKALIDSFVLTSESLSGDKLYKQGLVWGIFAMTLLKFWPKGRPITDPEVAQRYFNNSLRIIEQGYFSWPS